MSNGRPPRYEPEDEFPPLRLIVCWRDKLVPMDGGGFRLEREWLVPYEWDGVMMCGSDPPYGAPPRLVE